MPQNDFVLWGTAVNANVLTQAAYLARPDRLSGAVAGKASAQAYNKSLRQTSIISSMIAQFIVDRLNLDAVDDGTINTLETNFIAAVRSTFSIPNTGVTPGTYGPTMSLAVQADGRITGLSNTGLGATGVGAGTYTAPTMTIATDGRVTSAASVNYGRLDTANVWEQAQTLQHGAIATGTDAGTLHYRAVNANYGSGFLNDGVSTYLLSTGTGVPLGVYSSLRPFAWNMASGAVTIDGGGAGINTGGTLSALGRLRAGSGAFGSGDANAAAILGDFPFANAGTQPSTIGYVRFPNGLILQWGVGTIAPGTTIVNVTFPLVFTTMPISVMVNEISPSAWLIAGRTTVYAANALNNSQAQIIGMLWNTGTTSWAASDPASSGISFRWWAIGY